jgi:hypothetical protein
MPQVGGHLDGRGTSTHHDNAKPLPDVGFLDLPSCRKEVLDRFDGENVITGGMEGIHQDHAVLDKRCSPVFRHLFHVEAGLGRPVYAGEQAGTHSRIIVIRGRADQRDSGPGLHGIAQAYKRRHVCVATAHENQVLRHLPLSCFEAPSFIRVQPTKRRPPLPAVVFRHYTPRDRLRPRRFIHSRFSTCRLTDFDHTWRLLAAFCKAAPGV